MSTTMIGRRSAARGMAGALAAVVLIGSTVQAEEGFSEPLTLRERDGDLGIEDLAGKGRDVSIVWQDDTVALQLRTSTDGGRTFRSKRLVDYRHASNASTDVCAGFAWVAHSFRFEGEFQNANGLVVDGFALSGPAFDRERIVPSGWTQNVRNTDFACVGSRRRAVTWVDGRTSPSTVHVRFLPILPDPQGQVPPDFAMSFQTREGFASSALAANRKHAWLAWQTAERRIRVKAFDVGPGPEFKVTPGSAVTLPDSGSGSGRIALGAWGSKLVVAYGQNGDTFVRVSTDGGRTFGPREKLLSGLGGKEVTTAVSADIRGSRAVVRVDRGQYGTPDPRPFRFESTNDGAS